MLFWSCVSFAEPLKDSEIAQLARPSIVHLTVEFLSPNNRSNKCAESRQGTGFVISRNGYVLTAHHLFDPPKDCESFTEFAITGLVGGDHDVNPVPLKQAAEFDTFADAALLRFSQSSNSHSAARICRVDDLKAGEKLIAFGFPHNTGFATLPTTFSNPGDSGARWVVSSAITHGMSGGPIYDYDGNVVAFIQGGLKNTTAVRYIVPLGQIHALIRIARELPPCNSEKVEFTKGIEEQLEGNNNEPQLSADNSWICSSRQIVETTKNHLCLRNCDRRPTLTNYVLRLPIPPRTTGALEVKIENAELNCFAGGNVCGFSEITKYPEISNSEVSAAFDVWSLPMVWILKADFCERNPL